MTEPDDPRGWVAAAPPAAARLHALARAGLDAATRQEGDAAAAALRGRVGAIVAAGDGTGLAEVFATAPGGDVYRQLWRALVDVEATAVGDGLAATLFALPVVVVAGRADGVDVPLTLSAVLGDAAGAATLLREHDALAGNRTFALGNALVGAEALDLPQLPALLAHRRAAGEGALAAPPDLPPAPMTVPAGHESVHLRFLVGVALAAPGVDLLRTTDVGRWGMPLARALAGDLAVPGATVLALPHAPRRLVPALQAGRALQREISAQVFLSNALRTLRASIGEPAAVISAHRRPDAPSGGELRLSLSSPLGPRDAQGFRCPLYAADRIADVVAMLATLLADCRVTDVRVLPGVHADRDADTGVSLLFRADLLH